MILHDGDSSIVLVDFPDECFDFIYLDGDHRYFGVRNDLLVAINKIKPEGFIACNDYTIYSPLGNAKYGVYKAVNEICLEYDFEIVYIGLHYWGYHDAVIRKIRE